MKTGATVKVRIYGGECYGTVVDPARDARGRVAVSVTGVTRRVARSAVVVPQRGGR